MESDLAALAPQGRIILFGNAAGSPLAPVQTTALYARNASVGGFSMAALSASSPETVGNAMRSLLDRIADGAFTPEVTVVQGLHHAPELQQKLATGTAVAKYVIAIAARPTIQAARCRPMHETCRRGTTMLCP